MAWWGKSVPAFEDAGALDDPVGIEAEPLVEMVVGDDAIGHVAAGRQDANAGQAATARSRGWVSFFVHEHSTDLPARTHGHVPQAHQKGSIRRSKTTPRATGQRRTIQA